MLEVLGSVGKKFLIGLAILVLGIPGIILVYGGVAVYILAPLVGGIWLAIGVVYPFASSFPIPHEVAVAITIAAAAIVAVLGWSIEHEINERTEFPFEMLDM